MTQIPPISDHLPLSIRAYALANPMPDAQLSKKRKPTKAKATEHTLIFDTETDADTGQALRFGTYQMRKGGEVLCSGIFYAPDNVTADELECLTRYAEGHDLDLLTRDEFADRIFYRMAYQWRARIVGFNLPFDISRIATSHGIARDEMRGGFTFKISPHKFHPNLRVKHLSRRAAFIKFVAPWQSPDNRSDRKNMHRNGFRPGHFVDVKTLAAALLAQSFSLSRLSRFLNVVSPKLEFDDFDGPITNQMIEYAVRDTQTTWECYAALIERFAKLGLDQSNPEKIYSEASIGKAYVRAMGIKPWRECHPDFAPELIGNIMATYFGGRSEVRIRREIRQVILCDFLSMYPTVCTLMGLWQFVISSGLKAKDTTEATRQLLANTNIAELQTKSAWQNLSTLVRIEADTDILPVRSAYGVSYATNIGLNYLTGDKPLWFTLADCMASKLLTDNAPRIIEAVTYYPDKVQSGLSPIEISGNADYRVDPVAHDFYKRLIELRQATKRKRDDATGIDSDALETEQNALKIAANATSYGMYAEVNIEHNNKAATATVYSGTADPFEFSGDKMEKPGPFFHPLLSTLICGAARLMLAITERLVIDQGLDWSFCDTDSMAIAKPDNMDASDFQNRVANVVAYFEQLNPYDFGGSILQIERANFAIDDPALPTPLYCLAISAKRYALFNKSNDWQPILRKASAHGLGHLNAPYAASNPASGLAAPATSLKSIGVELWQHDLWLGIVKAALSGKPDQVDLSYHLALNAPAISRYAATTPTLLSWFKTYNHDRSYSNQVTPFNFLSAFVADKFADNCAIGTESSASTRRSPKAIRPVAPFHNDPAIAASMAFDRNTGAPVKADTLKTYTQALAQYHLHPENKFLNGNYLDSGTTLRRHVHASSIRHIGKEAHDWERQAHLGLDKEAQIDYGITDVEETNFAARLGLFVAEVGMRKASKMLKISAAQIEGHCKSEARQPTLKIRQRLNAAISRETSDARKRDAEISELREMVRRSSYRKAARELGIDPSNLRRKIERHLSNNEHNNKESR